jgi:hypothetical protein
MFPDQRAAQFAMPERPRGRCRRGLERPRARCRSHRTGPAWAGRGPFASAERSGVPGLLNGGRGPTPPVTPRHWPARDAAPEVTPHRAASRARKIAAPQRVRFALPPWCHPTVSNDTLAVTLLENR